MTATPERVFIEALALPSRQRAALVQKLLISLEADGPSAEIEEAWRTEALDRCTAANRGEMNESSATDVLARTRSKIK